MRRVIATEFRRKFLAGVHSRAEGLTAGEATDFKRDLQMYEELLARDAAKQRVASPLRKSGRRPSLPLDRCAVLLRFLVHGKGRGWAASAALTGIEEGTGGANCRGSGSHRQSTLQLNEG